MSEVGAVIGGRYRLERLLGRGGMGSVWAAEHTVIGRRVAIKLLHKELAEAPGMAERFIREARAASGIDHANVIRVQDVGGGDGEPMYIVMELLQGQR